MLEKQKKRAGGGSGVEGEGEGGRGLASCCGARVSCRDKSADRPDAAAYLPADHVICPAY